VGVFYFNEGNVGEFLIGPCKGDAPFGNAGIGIDGISPASLQFVVMERMKAQKVFFGGMVEDEQAFLGFIDSYVAQLPSFFFGQIVAAENLFREWIGEAFDHRGKL